MRARITLLVAATTSVVLIAFLVPMTVLIGRVAAADAVNAAEAATQSLVPVVASGDQSGIRDLVGGGQLGDFPVSVHLADGTVIGEPVGRDPGVAAAAASRTTSVVRSGGEAVIYQPVFGDTTTVIRTVVPHARLTRGVTVTRGTLMALGLGLFLLSLIVADRLARTMTRPLRELAATAERLGTGDLAARLQPAGPPEVQEVGVALNRLAARIRELLAVEREAVADLSHRLRTPVTALRLDTEALTDADDRARLTSDVDALDRTVGAIIQEARRPVREGGRASCDAAAVVAERVRFWSALADEQGRSVELDVPPRTVAVRTSAEDLASALDALLGNVFAHTPDGVAVRVTLSTTGGGAVLSVEDDGPGIPAGALVRGTSGSGSTGLGLDIARRTAEATGGGLEIGRTAAGGARVTMTLGAAR
jgi:signal transduction histidine kinase